MVAISAFVSPLGLTDSLSLCLILFLHCHGPGEHGDRIGSDSERERVKTHRESVLSRIEGQVQALFVVRTMSEELENRMLPRTGILLLNKSVASFSFSCVARLKAVFPNLGLFPFRTLLHPIDPLM